MTWHYKTACVFGGTGFIGRHIVRELANLGYTVKVATRTPEKAYFLKPYGAVGQIVPFRCDYTDEKSIQSAVQGCQAVVNLVGILYEKGKSAFDRIHVDFPAAIAKACHEEKVERFVHVSALGADRADSKYARSKLKGESAVFEAFPKATILRPSVVFGAGDSFFNMFAGLAKIFPALPLFGGGETRFQPVYVGDVAHAALAAITVPDIGDQNPQGKIYELGGPEVLSFKEIYERLFDEIHVHRPFISVPWPIARLQGRILSLLPKPLLTADQVKSLETDNIVSSDALTLKDMGIEPTGMQAILPEYLVQYRPGGRFGQAQSA